MSAKCRLLAVDLDGTLVNHGRIADEDARALHEACHHGIAIVLCTGRSWAETQPVWRELALPQSHVPVICVGGAVVVDPHTGRSLCSRSFEHETAHELSSALRKLGYPVMALVDAWREGFDYYMVGQFAEKPLYQRFFGQQQARIRRVEQLDGLLSPRALRISIIEHPEPAGQLLPELRSRFVGQIEIQGIFAPNYGVYILEAFSAGTTKFSALVYVGQAMRLGAGMMAAIGDDYNDISMLAGVARSAAPQDAPPDVLKAAKSVVPARGQAAVAAFVSQLLAEG
jgi:Cof subfamily protein (haloacid dehalogenase superfamily)